MKKLLGIVVFILFPAIIFSQEQTLLNGRVEHGGYGGPVVKFTQLQDDFGVLVGGHGAWIINHGIALGGGGYGLVNDITVTGLSPDTTRYLDLGYGGFEFGIILTPMQLIHFEFNTLIGAGGVSQRNSFFNDDFESHDEGDGFFVLEPSMSVELNVTRFMRLTGGVSYRYTNGARMGPIDDGDLSGLSGVIALKFGSF